MHCVAGGSVNNGAVCDVLSIVNEDGPDLYEQEECEICEFLKRKDEWEDVVW